MLQKDEDARWTVNECLTWPWVAPQGAAHVVCRYAAHFPAAVRGTGALARAGAVTLVVSRLLIVSVILFSDSSAGIWPTMHGRASIFNIRLTIRYCFEQYGITITSLNVAWVLFLLQQKRARPCPQRDDGSLAAGGPSHRVLSTPVLRFWQILFPISHTCPFFVDMCKTAPQNHALIFLFFGKSWMRVWRSEVIRSDSPSTDLVTAETHACDLGWFLW